MGWGELFSEPEKEVPGRAWKNFMAMDFGTRCRRQSAARLDFMLFLLLLLKRQIHFLTRKMYCKCVCSSRCSEPKPETETETICLCASQAHFHFHFAPLRSKILHYYKLKFCARFCHLNLLRRPETKREPSICQIHSRGERGALSFYYQADSNKINNI